MIRTILLDMDDTLVRNESLSFFRGYVTLLAPHLRPWMDEQGVYTLMSKTGRAMMSNQDPTKTLWQVFWEAVAAAGFAEEELAPAFDEFYAAGYPQLETQMGPIPGARAVLEWLREQGYELVIATGPLFPEAAIRKRLEWGQVADLPYVLITSCENMHFAKPNPCYFQETLDLIGRHADDCVMVGNDPGFDMAARQLGIKTYLVCQQPPSPEVAARVDGHGPLSGLRPWLESFSSAAGA